jgi:hypothetical protein
MVIYYHMLNSNYVVQLKDSPMNPLVWAIKICIYQFKYHVCRAKIQTANLKMYNINLTKLSSWGLSWYESESWLSLLTRNTFMFTLR